MYDRKTWIIVGICSVLLAVNLYFQNINQAARRAQLAAEQAKAAENQPAEKAADAKKPEKSGESAKPSEKPEATPEKPAKPTVEEVLAKLETDEAEFVFTNLGGGVKQASMKHQTDVKSDTPVRINRFGTNAVGELSDGTDRFEHLAYEQVAGESIPGEQIVYRAVNSSGLEITKKFRKVDPKEPGGAYLLDFDLTVRNTAEAPQPLDRWTVSVGSIAPLYQREWANQIGFFWRRHGNFKFVSVSKFKSGFFSKGKNVIEYGLENLEYAGVSNQFFATVLRSADPYDSSIWAKARDIHLPGNGEKPRKAVRAGIALPAVQLAPGESKTIHYRLFMGPKHNRMLRKMGHGYGDVMNYGWFSVFSRFLSWMLYWIHNAVDKVAGKWSWGLAIILLTIVLRGAMWPLQNASTRTMKRMSKLKPEMDKLKEKYGDDPTKMNQEMMKLYKKFHINPMGGCLPMFVQIPIFFGFYRMLQYAVELRGMEFLWVSDLSQPDTIMTIGGVPINLLPIVMGLSSFAQIAITPKTGDKNQQRIMYLMPFMFFFICYNFAAALALYWTTSNLFAIGQTWLTNKLPEPELKERKTSGKSKKTWMERLAEKQAEIERIQREQAARRSGAPIPKSDKPKKKRPPRTGG